MCAPFCAVFPIRLVGMFYPQFAVSTAFRACIFHVLHLKQARNCVFCCLTTLFPPRSSSAFLLQQSPANIILSFSRAQWCTHHCAYLQAAQRARQGDPALPPLPPQKNKFNVKRFLYVFTGGRPGTCLRQHERG